MVEDIIFILTNNVEILETNKKIQSYKEVTIKNRSKLSKDELYIYSPPPVDVEGPLPPRQEDLHQAGFTQHIKTASSQERAGGYEETIGCYRAVQEAMAGLYFVPGQGEVKG